MNRVYFVLLVGLLGVCGCKSSQPAAGSGERFTLSGNSPFWTVEISTEGITFEELGKQIVAYPYKPSVRAGDRINFVFAKDASGNDRRIRISLTKSPCLDRMVGGEQPYQAEVELDGKTYLGCGK
ncbi:MAG: hypothetical protein AAF798_21355 [Bacteroidota bacterium]